MRTLQSSSCLMALLFVPFFLLPAASSGRQVGSEVLEVLHLKLIFTDGFESGDTSVRSP